MSQATSFCPECGTENAAAAERCNACGRVLDPLAQLERVSKAGANRKLDGAVLGTVASVCVGTVVIAWLAGLSLELDTQTVLRFDGDKAIPTKLLSSSASLAQVFAGAIGFALAGVVAAVVSGGRYIKELVLGATAGLAVQLTIWLVTIELAGGSPTQDLWIVGEGFVMRGPAGILLAQLLLLTIFSALMVGFFGWIVRELITGKAVCVHCGKPHSIKPRRPARCPHCDAEQERDGIQWGAVLSGSLISALVFGSIVALLREPLGIALECRSGAIGGGFSDACSKAHASDDFTIFVIERSQDSYVFWAIDQWRYLEIGAALVLVATLALALLVKRGSRASAGALIPIYWVLVSFVVMVVLADLGGSEAGFIFLLRLQVLGLVIWGVAGAIGVLIGDKLRYREGSAYLDEIE